MSVDERGGVAVVTGASRGLGAAIAKRLASEGMAVACAATSAENAEPVAAEIRAQFGVAALAVQMLVEDRDSVETALSLVEQELGPISVMVNNAGVASVTTFLDMAEADFNRVIDINVKGVFNGGQAAARRMVASGTPGSIVNLGSIAGVNAFPLRMGYSTSKAAVHQMTKIMALDLAEHQIRVNCVAPGYIRTDMVQDIIDAGTLDEERLMGRVPLGDLGTVADIAAAVSWVASTEARYVTGAVMVIDGGWSAYGHI